MRKVRAVLISLLVSFALIVTFHKPTRVYIVDKTNLLVNNLIDKVTGTIDNFTLVQSTSANIVDDVYYLDIIVKSNKVSDVSNVTINDLDIDELSFEDNIITVNIDDLINFDNSPYLNIKISSIKTSKKTINVDYNDYIFKPITDATINNVKSSMVSIYAKDGNQVSWGSGVIYKRESSFLLYEYFVLTNYHVVKDKTEFEIYYENNDGLPVKIPHVDHVTANLVNRKVDLAILSFKTTANINYLNDLQFQTLEPNIVIKGQPIYTISSPGGNNENFNAVKQGTVINTNMKVGLIDSDICPNGCLSFQTNISLIGGSSGGGTFNANGQLVGIHFAGNKENTVSNSIPMDIVLEFITKFELERSTAYINKKVHYGLFLF